MLASFCKPLQTKQRLRGWALETPNPGRPLQPLASQNQSQKGFSQWLDALSARAHQQDFRNPIPPSWHKHTQPELLYSLFYQRFMTYGIGPSQRSSVTLVCATFQTFKDVNQWDQWVEHTTVLCPFFCPVFNVDNPLKQIHDMLHGLGSPTWPEHFASWQVEDFQGLDDPVICLADFRSKGWFMLISLPVASVPLLFSVALCWFSESIAARWSRVQSSWRQKRQKRLEVLRDLARVLPRPRHFYGLKSVFFISWAESIHLSHPTPSRFISDESLQGVHLKLWLSALIQLNS